MAETKNYKNRDFTRLRDEMEEEPQEPLYSNSIVDPDLVKALVDVKRDRASGVIEIHFSQGGIAKIFSKVSKTYK